MVSLCYKLIYFKLLLLFLPFVISSFGDRSPFYQKCCKSCKTANCTEDGVRFQSETTKLKEKSIQLLWNCKDDCNYNCMWRTVEAFQVRGYEIPKFHGKWPFKRILGIQEPASVFASILNLLVHIYMYYQIFEEFSIKEVKMAIMWHVYAIVSINAWIWSTIFHTRDTSFTEFMDYACAFSLVVIVLLCAIIRIYHKHKWISLIFSSATVIFYFVYVYTYLYSQQWNYDYNMHVNAGIAILGLLMWLVWATIMYLQRKMNHARRLIVFITLLAPAFLLEILDFPPVYGWDAHALWHLSTVPLTPLFYRFAIEDLRYMQKAWLTERKGD